MSQVLFQRVVRVLVGSLLVEGLRVQFKVKKTTAITPNECELQIYNLSQKSRAGLQAKGIKIVVEAGYQDHASRIFSGDSRYIDHKHNGPDWVTKVQCGDGERAYRYVKVNESFKPGTTVASVFYRMAVATGLDVSQAVELVGNEITEQFTQGYSTYGRVSEEIDRLLQGRGLEWSIQDGKLQVTRVGQPVKGSAVLLSASTGMIGSPAHGSPEFADKTQGTPIPGQKKPQVLKVKSLLQPGIVPGGLIRLDSLEIKGDFRVQSVLHTGDTFGGDFYTEADVLPVS